MDFSGIREYLIEQEAKCINESGYEMSMDDIAGHIQSPEFVKKFGIITLEQLFHELLVSGERKKSEKGKII